MIDCQGLLPRDEGHCRPCVKDMLVHHDCREKDLSDGNDCVTRGGAPLSI